MDVETPVTQPTDRFARLREAWANVMNTDLDDAAGDARMIVETVPSLLAALDAAEALATAVEQMGITENEIERYRFRQDAFDSARAFRAAMEAK